MWVPFGPQSLRFLGGQHRAGEFGVAGLGSGRVRWELGPGSEASVCSRLVGCVGGAKCKLEPPCKGEEGVGA